MANKKFSQFTSAPTPNANSFFVGYNSVTNDNTRTSLSDLITAIGGNYLPLAGGTLTGALGGTSAIFSGALEINNNALTQDGTRPIVTLKQSGTSKLLLGIASTASDIIVGDAIGDVDFRTNSQAFNFSVNNGGSIAFKLASSGAATFSADATINGVTVGLGGGDISSNTAVGISALAENTSGGGNIAVGANALNYNTVGDNNTAVGNQALYTNTNGNSNTAVGINALYANIDGGNNIAVGENALNKNISGSGNIALGNQALYSNIDGFNNTAVGSSVLSSNTSGVYNTAVGNQALYQNIDGNYNTAVGSNVLSSNQNGVENTAVGNQALFNNIDGGNNIAIGTQALYENISGVENTAVGAEALKKNITSNNTAVGYRTLYNNTQGFNNTAIGNQALYTNAEANDNTAVGNQALYSNNDGSRNTAVGIEALYANIAGFNNTAVGVGALKNSEENNNTALGYNAGLDLTGKSSNNIFIGSGQNCPDDQDINGTTMLGVNDFASGSNQMRFGSALVINGQIDENEFSQQKRWNVYINGANYWIPLQEV